MTRTAVVVMLILGCCQPARAQSSGKQSAAADQDETRPLGPLFTVRLDDGSAIAGHQLQMDPDTVRLVAERRVRDLPMSTVTSIERQGDSLKNGPIVGAAVLGGLCALGCLQGVNDGVHYASAVTLNAAWGALIGLVIDWRTHGTTTVYRAPDKNSRSALPSVTPVLSREQSSLALRWRW